MCTPTTQYPANNESEQGVQGTQTHIEKLKDSTI
jgi:hypothetical protein